MNANKEPSNFWTTLPGILTGFAALITALGGIYLGIRASETKVKNPDALGQTKNLTVYADSTRGEEFTNEENKPIKVNFKATGTWLAIPENISVPGIPDNAKGYLTAAGATDFRSNNEKMPCPSFPMGALVVMKEDGSCVDNGVTGSFELKQGEKVYLKMNDVGSLYSDNKGNIQVGLSW